MSRIAPKPEVIRALFALSGNQCAFPNCSHLLISDKGTFISQLCHIEAANKGGQRYNPKQTDEERRSQENLLLLCYAHHRETDDEIEYTVERLKEIKNAHEQQFKNQYKLPETLLEKVQGSIQIYLDNITTLSQDTNLVVHGLEDKMNELLKRTSLATQDNSEFTTALQFIKELKEKGNYKTAIDKLLEFKVKSWDKLRPELKYKVLANLGLTYLDIHDKSNASKYFQDLNDIDYETADSLAFLCLGYALTANEEQFDINFEKALKKGSKNINLWVAYIERYRKVKNADELLKELPSEVIGSIPVLFSIGGMLIDEGRKKEGIALLKKTLEIKEENNEKKSDTLAIIATRLLPDIINPYKFVYDHFSEEEIEQLLEAKALLTEAWNGIDDTEMATYKWYIILNRGVINKVTKQNNQAILDFQRAYDLSKEFLPFKNLLMMYIQIDNLYMAEQLLEHHGITRTLNEEELFEMQTFKARLLCFKDKYRDGIALLIAELDTSNEKRYSEIINVIISTYFEFGTIEEAIPWCEKLINEFPEMIIGYLHSGFLSRRMNQGEKSLAFYLKAETLFTNATPQIEIYELASGYMDLGEYERAIPLFERLANKNKLNSFSRGLIHAYYQYGDLQAAYAIAENLFFMHPKHPYLVEIISNILRETKQYDKAISIIEDFIPSATDDHVKDVFTFRLADLYSQKRDRKNTRRYALQVKEPDKFPLNDVFRLASMLVLTGEIEKGMEIAFNARTRFFDESLAHLMYTQICIATEKEDKDLFPSAVRNGCAVTIKTETGEEKVFLITDKNTKGENVLKADDAFSQQLIGKERKETVLINKGFGFSYAATIIDILDIYTYAFRESLKLFETRFAGQQGIGVFHANPGQPGDQLEQFIKDTAKDRTNFQKQAYDLYDQRKATIGVLAGLFNQNVVRQWFTMLSSQDVFVISYSRNEHHAVEYAINNNTALILDLTALLTMFFISRNKNHFSHLYNKYIVSQSTIDELQAFYEELESGAKDGIFTVDYQDGRMVGNSIPKETVQRNREILQNIIIWCREHTLIVSSNKLLQIKRKERKKMSDTLGHNFYDTFLLAEEHSATVISDDDNFKNIVRSGNCPSPFSTYELALYLSKSGKITNADFELFRMQLIMSNHIFIPLSADQLWQSFDNSGFQIGKPFTVAVQGLLIMRPEFCAYHLAVFFKKIYLESGLATTKQQTILYVINVMMRRNDFIHLKELLIVAIKKEFRLLQNFKDDILQLLSAF